MKPHIVFFTKFNHEMECQVVVEKNDYLNTKVGFCSCSLCTRAMFPDQSISNTNFRKIFHLPKENSLNFEVKMLKI